MTNKFKDFPLFIIFEDKGEILDIKGIKSENCFSKVNSGSWGLAWNIGFGFSSGSGSGSGLGSILKIFFWFVSLLCIDNLFSNFFSMFNFPIGTKFFALSIALKAIFLFLILFFTDKIFIIV